ncbi:VC0807 family protein [Bacillus sp. SCS-151]|uniref:VC0807 family protein n=1 Tax=Nanhaiella sioensis TaxID=3115293 RepID=UPI00397CDA7F
MKNNVVIFDIIFYVVFPLVVWNLGRDYIGDYYAMLLSSVPGIIYSLYRFFQLKKVNVFGIYMLATLVIGTLIEVLAGSALQLLWNQVFFAYAMAAFYLATVLTNKPLTLYFALDIFELQGIDKKLSKKIFFQRKFLIVFQLITIVFAVRSIVLAIIKTWLINEYGVDAFDKGILLRQAFSWIMTGVSAVGFIYIAKLISDTPELATVFNFDKDRDNDDVELNSQINKK